MPIRFHCPKCDQRLSVSSRKADTLVKCPSCKQTITVPSEAEAERAAAVRKAARHESRSQRPELQPATLAATVAPSSAENVAADGDNDNDLIEFAIFDTSDVPITSSKKADSRVVSSDRVMLSRKVFYYQGALLAIVGVLAFILGILVGRSVMAPSGKDAFSEPVTIRGRVTFENNGGDMLADDNAVVIAVPYDKRPTDDIPVDGIRPTDPTPIPNHPGVAGIMVLQGAYTRADANGMYELQLPRGGRFWLLAISRNAKTAVDVPKTHIAQLGRYFSSVSGLLGEQDYRWTEEFFKRNRSIDIEFER